MDQASSLTLRVRHEFGELYWANLKHFLSRLKFVLITLAVFLCAVGAILAVGAVTHTNIADTRPDFIANVRPLFILCAAVFVGAFALPWVATSKGLRDPRRKNGFTYYVSNQGVRVEGSVARSELDWTAFTKAAESRGAFSLFTTRHSFHLLPKRCFASPDEIELFRMLVRTNVPAARLKTQ